MEEKNKNKKEVIRAVKFVLVSASAGIVEIVVFTLMNELTGLKYWPCYLTALIAPRKISIVTAKEDEWADAEAQYLTAEATSVIYESMGIAGFDRSQGFLETGMKSIGGNIILSKRDGRHRFFPEDWEFFIDHMVKSDRDNQFRS